MSVNKGYEGIGKGRVIQGIITNLHGGVEENHEVSVSNLCYGPSGLEAELLPGVLFSLIRNGLRSSCFYKKINFRLATNIK
jgi:hypothetical protein